MSKQILITGGAGFIGSHLADELLAEGHRVRALDVLSPQVHPGRARPDYLNPDLLGEAGCVSIEAGVESITEEGRATCWTSRAD